MPANIQHMIMDYMSIKCYGSWSKSTSSGGHGWAERQTRRLTITKDDKWIMKIIIDGDTMYSDDGYYNETEESGKVVYRIKYIHLKRKKTANYFDDEWKARFEDDGNKCILFRKKYNLKKSSRKKVNEKIVLTR